MIPEDYPTDPPNIRFATKILHPNVDPKTGEISLDVLQERWSPEMTLLTILSALMALLIKPQPWYLRNEEAGMLYVHDYFEYRA